MSDGIELNLINKTKPTEGTGLNITCSGQSNPVFTDEDVKWTKQNDNEDFSQSGRFLYIEHVNRSQSGTYACSVVIRLTPTIDQPVNVTATTTVEVDVLCKYYFLSNRRETNAAYNFNNVHSSTRYRKQ